MRALAYGLLLISGTALAEPRAKPDKPPPAAPLPKADDTLAPARDDPTLLDRAYHRAVTKRNIGIGLAAPGVALTVLGAVLIGFAVFDPNLLSKPTEYISGGAAVLSGVGIGVPGVLLWMSGQDEMDVISWRRRQLVGPSIGVRF